MAEARAIEAANGQAHEAPKPASKTLRDLAARLTPNPARTIDGTLQIILSGIDNIDDETLARSLAHMNARAAGLDAGPISDEQWAKAEIGPKLDLLRAARSLKLALREISG